MRHFRSILYALVLAPAVWVLAGVGFTHDLTARGRDDFAVESVAGLLMLVLAGAAYAILLFAPISPAGPLVGGLAYLGISAWALAAPAAYAGVWPESVAKEGFDVSRPGFGLAALLAIPLICTALSARRWAGYEPPVLPLIGRLGRARGHVAMPPTAAVPRVTDTDPTMAMRLGVIAPSSNDTTAVVVGGRPYPDPDATTVLPPNAETAGLVSPNAATPAGVAAPDAAGTPDGVAAPDGTGASTGMAAPDEKTGENATTATDDRTAENAPVAVGSPADKSTARLETGRAVSTVQRETAVDDAELGGIGDGEAVAGDRDADAVLDVVVALAAEEPLKIGEVVDVAPEDEATIAVSTVRDERQTAVVVSWDEAATVAALFNGQASTRRAFVVGPPVELRAAELESADAGPTQVEEEPAKTSVDDLSSTAVKSGDEGVAAASVVVADGSESDSTPRPGAADDQPQLVAEPAIEQAEATDNGRTAKGATADEPADNGEATEAPIPEAADNSDTTKAPIPTEAHDNAETTELLAPVNSDMAEASTPVEAAGTTETLVPVETADHGQAGETPTPVEAVDGEMTEGSTPVEATDDSQAAEAATAVEVLDDAETTATLTPVEATDNSQTAGAAAPVETLDHEATEALSAVEATDTTTPDGEATETVNTADTTTPDDEATETLNTADTTTPDDEATETLSALDTTAPDGQETDAVSAVDAAGVGETADSGVAGFSDEDGDAEVRVDDDVAGEPVGGEPTASGEDVGRAGDELVAESVEEPASNVAGKEVGDDGVGDEVAGFVVGRATPVASTRGVPPELEETRSLEAPDPERTRAINLGELTTKLQITPANGEEVKAVNEPVRARATVAAPDTSGPDLSGAEITRSLTAPDPDRTRTIRVFAADDKDARETTDDGETTRSLSAPDPDRTQTIIVLSADAATHGQATHGQATHGQATHGQATHGQATHGQ
ncbi:hypothetical protein M1L60_20605, partial [Actinoplanes sp. TRM 88003]|nr:hypothetical protein [Actinoplanes aksuensis]